MSSRVSTRPRRTKMYDCNYLAGERYYRPVLDEVDRKYSGRPEPGAGLSSLRGALADAEASLGARPRASPDVDRAERRLLSTLLDEAEGEDASPFRRGGAARRRLAAALNDADQEDDAFFTSSRRVRESRARIAALEDEIAATKSSSRSKLRAADDFAEKVLDTVGLKNSDIGKARQFLEEDSFFKRRSRAVAAEDDDSGSKTLSKWTKLAADLEEPVETAAASRARQSRARLADLDAEMEQLESRAAARERRSANVRALLQETAEVGGEDSSSSVVRSSAMRVKKVSATAEKKTVTF